MPKRRRKKILAEGKFLQLATQGGWEFVRRKGATGVVAIVAVTDDLRLLLVEQYRPPLDANAIELPAGLVGDLDPGEEAELAVVRELEEETGYRPKFVEPLFAGPSSAGLTDEVVAFYRATGVKKVGPGGGDHNESIRVHRVPLADVGGWLRRKSRRGIWIDPKIYTGLYFLLSETG